MPVRKIPKSYRNVTGILKSNKCNTMKQFESPLERDFMQVLEFDPMVERYEEQPLMIEYKDSTGKIRKYTPDILAFPVQSQTKPKDKRPSLCEVKPRENLRKLWKEHEERFRAAYRLCMDKGWRFRIVTEREIRTPFLENAKFLIPHLRHTPDEHVQLALISEIHKHKHSTPRELLDYLEPDPWKAAAIMPQLWQMIAKRYILTDFNNKLTMNSQIWPN